MADEHEAVQAALRELVQWFGHMELRVRAIMARDAADLWLVELTRPSMQYQGRATTEDEATWEAILKAQRDMHG